MKITPDTGPVFINLDQNQWLTCDQFLAPVFFFFFSKTCVLVPVPHINRTGNPVLGNGVDSLKCWEETKPTILIK